MFSLVFFPLEEVIFLVLLCGSHKQHKDGCVADGGAAL